MLSERNGKIHISKFIHAALQARSDHRLLCRGACSKASVAAAEGHPRASLTIEAALAFPLFLFAAALLLLPFRVLEVNRKMQDICEQVCEDVCQYAYSASRDAEELDPEKNPRDQAIYTGISAGLGAYAAEKARKEADDSRIGVINFMDSSCMTDGETVKVSLTYYYKLPFSVLGLGTLHQNVISSRRAWIGKKRTKTAASGENGQETMVYVGKNSTRYHLTATCHYLSNDLTAVLLSEIDTLRNKSGGKYHPCATCARETGGVLQVYVMPNGSSYHTEENCRSIISYVKQVPLSEVESLGVCSYCGK